ncbi:MAG TPA: LemA family protein [Chitinophagales bacterium]|nr:LemA family protein [Chitinophagales bacterium]HMZ90525.1 LemA family protein [Chitinophagales bacterium]HNA58039.1 LemA family protein [Chitinophagales bacterium]HNE45513.1 LemA family protein [Chitinophagales bacterium]HNF69083.1 LemA family protein [Chitinophagales bacterium]
MTTTTPAAAARNPKMGRYIGIGIVVVLILYLISLYNGIMNADETVNQKWGDVESNYKRRYDLIDNLVNTVKGAADFEKSTLTELVEARAKATSITIDPATATPEQIKAFMAAQSGVSTSLGRLLAVVENYPQLTATQAYRDLMVSLEGTENRINVARMDYNEAVKNYNVRIRKFPGNLIAGIAGLDRRNTFDAPEGVEDVPKVDFGTK